jgi:hypothetical protein
MNRLPDRSNLDHLKKQAKDLIRLYRRGDAEAIARFRRALPEAAGRSDDEIASLELRLHDAHIVRALARTASGIPVDHFHLQKIDGDALDFVVVRRALAGVDVVIQSLGLSVGPEVIFRPVRLFSEATRILPR